MTPTDILFYEIHHKIQLLTFEANQAYLNFNPPKIKTSLSKAKELIDLYLEAISDRN